MYICLKIIHLYTKTLRLYKSVVFRHSYILCSSSGSVMHITFTLCPFITQLMTFTISKIVRTEYIKDKLLKCNKKKKFWYRKGPEPYAGSDRYTNAADVYNNISWTLEYNIQCMATLSTHSGCHFYITCTRCVCTGIFQNSSLQMFLIMLKIRSLFASWNVLFTKLIFWKLGYCLAYIYLKKSTSKFVVCF